MFVKDGLSVCIIFNGLSEIFVWGVAISVNWPVDSVRMLRPFVCPSGFVQGFTVNRLDNATMCFYLRLKYWSMRGHPNYWSTVCSCSLLTRNEVKRHTCLYKVFGNYMPDSRHVNQFTDKHISIKNSKQKVKDVISSFYATY